MPSDFVFDPTQRLRPHQARSLLNAILKDGRVEFTRHALESRMPQRHMTTADVLNILRAGRITEPEWENGEWRYRVETPRMGAVITFETVDSVLVITVLRYDRAT